MSKIDFRTNRLNGFDFSARSTSLLIKLILNNIRVLRLAFMTDNAHPMTMPSTAPIANRLFLFGYDGTSGGVAYSNTLKVSGWNPAAKIEI